MNEYVKMPPVEEYEMLMVKPEDWEKLTSELIARDEQLAEMREALENTQRIVGDPAVAFHDRRAASVAYSAIAEIAEIVNKALSAAPRRGRVLWEGIGGWDTETHEEHKPILWLPFENGMEMGRTPEPLTDDDGQSVTVTVKEAPPTGPIDCPMCGTAGGDELGPCSMCKGAGFVDGDDIPDGLEG